MATKVSPLSQLINSATQNVTPVRLWFLLITICLSSVVFCIAACITVEQHVHAIKTIGADAAPSVFAAHQIKIGLETMDADLADQLLYPPGQLEGQECLQDFDKSRLTVGNHLVAAAKNITYGPREQVPIENIENALGKFEMQSQAAFDIHSLGKGKATTEAYRNALETLETQLLPNCDALAKANEDILEDTYAREKGASAMSRGFVMVMGLVTIALLLYTQIYLRLRFRRAINLPLFLSLISLACFLQHLTSELADSSRQLKVAKEDSYNSIIALLEARSNSFEANAAESRWLLDRERAAEHEKLFSTKIGSVARFESGHDFPDTIATVQRQLANGEKTKPQGLAGSLADELNNIRFEEEGQAALEALQNFAQYLAIDKEMRKLESSGAHDAALKLGLGYDPNGSNFQFSKFDDALVRTLQINQEHLERAVNQSVHDLNGLALGSSAVSVLIIICTYLGLRPRMEEYQPSNYLHKRYLSTKTAN